MSDADQILTINQTSEQLEGVHGDDYYWYLRSPQFRKAFLEPLANTVNSIGLPCLDVGCGEAVLADYLIVPYVGVDGSATAINKAKQRLKGTPALGDRALICGRFEQPDTYKNIARIGLNNRPCTIVFGGVLDVLVKPEYRAAFVDNYRKLFLGKYVIIYDLDRFDHHCLLEHPLLQYYKLVKTYHNVATDIDLEPTCKLHRKIITLRCEQPILVYAPGVWDLLHVGHINFLQKAKALGDSLVVGVAGDKVVMEDKGHKSVIPAMSRLTMVKSLRMVDKVLVYSELDFLPQLMSIRPQVLAVGEDWGKDKRHEDAEEWAGANDCQVIRIPRYPYESTTAIRSRIV